jgi:hypothetical protein
VPKPWLRLWDKTLDSHKAQSLSGDSFKSWCNLLCLANRQEDRGTLPTMDAISFALRTRKDRVDKLIDELVDAGLIDRADGKLTMHDWDEWQPEWDSSTERTREYRNRKRVGDHPKTSPSIVTENGSDVTVTSRDGHCDAPDTDTDTDTEKNTPLKPPRGGRVPAFDPPEWVPRDLWDAWIEGRKKKPTVKALELAVKHLEKFRQSGCDPREVLERAIVGGWSGLFEVKGARAGNGAAPKAQVVEYYDHEAEMKRLLEQ